MKAQVAVVGAGPVGLMLACELARASVDVLVLERLSGPTGLSKALGLMGRAQDYLDIRGLLERFRHAAPTVPYDPKSLLHFGRLPLRVDRTHVRPKGVFVPQSLTEALLEMEAARLGVTIIRDRAVVGLSQDETGVLLHTQQGETVEAAYVVGCDGGRSVVRTTCGIPFPVAAPTALLRLADVKLTPGAQPPPFMVPLGDGYLRVFTKEALPPNWDRSSTATLADMLDSIRRQFGVDLPIAETRWVSQFTDASGVAERYRRGRVLIAGDAAHIHMPTGGPGLLTGFGDALNLGFKLAGVIAGQLETSVLDTYEAERRPVASAVVMQTTAQGALSEPTASAAALRSVFSQLVEIPQVIETLLGVIWQTDVRYAIDGGADHDLVGRFLPDAVLDEPAEGGRVARLMHDGSGLLLAFDLPPAVEHELGRRSRRLRVVQAEARPTDEALLVRPDGHVAWAGSPHSDEAGLRTALRRWFG